VTFQQRVGVPRPESHFRLRSKRNVTLRFGNVARERVLERSRAHRDEAMRSK
jgi:hypothetical protein